MGTAQGTMRLRVVTDPHRLARFACALAITLLVGIFSYAATYRALIVISTPSGVSTGTTTVVPDKSSTTQTPVSTAPVVSIPSH